MGTRRALCTTFRRFGTRVFLNIAPAFSGIPNMGMKSELATKPYLLGGPQQEEEIRIGYITPALSGVPNRGKKSEMAT